MLFRSGIGGDETEWQHYAPPEVILGDLLADGKAVPMIAVMPNGRAQTNDHPTGDVFQHAAAFAKFESDLLDDEIPAIESHYSVKEDREHRALAGLSFENLLPRRLAFGPIRFQPGGQIRPVGRTHFARCLLLRRGG